jgi:putative tryptophan/tyrosine transport system substrate-binding protein
VRRREFFTLVGGLTWPFVTWAQLPRVAKIGILVLGNSDPDEFLSTLRGGLLDRGYVEGQNVQFEFCSANGHIGLLLDLAAELTRLKVDVIVAWQTPAVEAAMQATRDIPIVMASAGSAGDPVGTGLVASLASPGTLGRLPNSQEKILS